MAKILSQQGGGPKTPVQEAIREMRELLKLSQDALASKLGKTTVTVTRWETTRPPKGTQLAELHNFARENELVRQANVLARAQEEEGSRPVTIQEGILLDSLLDILRNRDLPGVMEHCAAIVAEIRAAYEALVKQSDTRLSRHTPREQIESQWITLKAEVEKNLRSDTPANNPVQKKKTKRKA